MTNKLSPSVEYNIWLESSDNDSLNELGRLKLKNPKFLSKRRPKF